MHFLIKGVCHQNLIHVSVVTLQFLSFFLQNYFYSEYFDASTMPDSMHFKCGYLFAAMYLIETLHTFQKNNAIIDNYAWYASHFFKIAPHSEIEQDIIKIHNTVTLLAKKRTVDIYLWNLARHSRMWCVMFGDDDVKKFFLFLFSSEEVSRGKSLLSYFLKPSLILRKKMLLWIVNIVFETC